MWYERTLQHSGCQSLQMEQWKVFTDRRKGYWKDGHLYMGRSPLLSFFSEAAYRCHRPNDSCWPNGKPLLDWNLGLGPPFSLLHCSFCPLLCAPLCFLRYWVHGSLQWDQMGLTSPVGLLLQKDLKEPVWEELNHSPHWRKDVVALTTYHTWLTEAWHPARGKSLCWTMYNFMISVAGIFSCSIFLMETWPNISQPVLQVPGISRMHLLGFFGGFFMSSISCVGSILVPRATEVVDSLPNSFCQVEIPQWGAPSIPMPNIGMVWITQYQWSFHPNPKSEASQI